MEEEIVMILSDPETKQIIAMYRKDKISGKIVWYSIKEIKSVTDLNTIMTKITNFNQ